MRKRIILLSIIGALVATGCINTSRTKGLKPSEGWSRSVELGEHVVGSVGIRVDQESGETYLVWVQEIDDEISIRFMALNDSAIPIAEKKIDLANRQARRPKLVLAGDGALHLFWSSREGGDQRWDLVHLLISQDGTTLSDQTQLSLPDAIVDWHDIISDGEGGALVSWSLEGESGIYFMQLDALGNIYQQRTKIISDGERPSIRIGNDGKVHLAYRGEEQIYYAGFFPGQLGSVKSQAVSQVAVSGGNSMFGPSIGLSDGWVYVLWSVLNQTGLEAGTAFTEYISFPQDQVSNSNATRMGMLSLENQPFESYAGEFNFDQIVSPDSVLRTSNYVYQPITLEGERNELVVSIAFMQQVRMDFYQQIGFFLFEDGDFMGYGIAAKTTSISNRPTITASEDGELYVAWREGAGGNRIYFSSTAENIESALGKLDSGDWIVLLLQGGMEALTGIMFFPLVGLGVLLPGLLVVGAYKLVRDFETINNKESKYVVVGALAVFQGMKTFFIPAVRYYVPFSAWIEMPQQWHTPLQILVPIVIFVIGMGIAMKVSVRRGGASSVIFYLAQAIPDMVLTLAIYGVEFLGVI